MFNDLSPLESLVIALMREGIGLRLIASGSPAAREMAAWLESSFPFGRWGKIDWDLAVPSHVGDWRSEDELEEVARRVLGETRAVRDTLPGDEVCFVPYDDAQPSVCLAWRDAQRHLRLLLAADSDLWLGCPERLWCFEKTSVGHVGCVAK